MEKDPLDEKENCCCENCETKILSNTAFKELSSVSYKEHCVEHGEGKEASKMGWKKKFSALETTLIVLFILVTIVSVALIVLLATGESGDCNGPPQFIPECPSILESERVDCYPDGGASKDKCVDRGCCWLPISETNVPWCFFSKNHGYEAVHVQRPSQKGFEVQLRRLPAPSLFGKDIEQAHFSAEIQTRNRFRFTITDPNKARFEVPHEHIKPFTGPAASSPNYEVELIHKPFGFKLRRASTKKVLFDTTMGPIQFADQYLQLTARLPSHNIYGLGEHVHQNFQHSTDWRTWPMFTRDAFPNGGSHNLYGHQTFFLCLEDNSGRSLGVFLLNSNAMEVTLQPTPAITYRTIGGILDFYIFLGDSPEAVVKEYLELIGRPAMPSYWSLGFQLCRWDYGSIEELKATVERNRQIGLPYDIQYTDVDYMEDKKIFTYDLKNFHGLPEFADDLHNHGQKYIILLDPAVATSARIAGPYHTYDLGNKMGVWVYEADGTTPLLGEVWPGETVFPDFTNPACNKWWVDECEKLFRELKYDGLWIDMNEISNFQKGSANGCTANDLNYPPFTPSILDDLMYSKTLCMDAKQTWGAHYDVHSLYGYSMTLSTEEALKRVLPDKRGNILSRSTFAGSGKFTGHWLGDNAANWNDIKWAIPGMLEFSLFGIPYIGADICGFFDDTTEELCTRWMQVGAFYTFSRNHNAQGYKPQDPAYFGANSELVRSAKHYLNIRYTLLPYLYTLFHHAHVNGDTVTRPMMHEFYSDPATWKVDRQFLWGPGLLITPVLDPGTSTVSAYIPDAVWYDYETEVRITPRKQQIDMHLPADKLGLHLRGGHIFPIQQPANTTVYSRKNPMGLIIALDDNGNAGGELFWDDGEARDSAEKGVYVHYQFSVIPGLLKMEVLKNGYADPHNLKFEEIKILGVSEAPSSMTVTHNSNVTAVPFENFQYDTNKKVLHVTGLQLELGQSYLVHWINEVYPGIERFDCYPEDNSNQAACEARGCIWKTANTPGVPWCFYPRDYGYITNPVTNTSEGLSFQIKRNTAHPKRYTDQSPSIETLQVDVKYLDNYILQFKIYDPNNKRYEVPVPFNIPQDPAIDPSKRLYEVIVENSPFGIKVKRTSTGTVIWDSHLPGFTFTDMFIQISSRLPSKYVYGFGETEHPTFKHDLNWHTWGKFAKDQPPGYKLNSYGVHPFYMCLEDDANAHGVLLHNSNAMDVTFQPTPALTYRTVGGILDFYLVLGPTPELVVQEYTALIGRPVLPAYWSLGFQLCRYGYENDTEIKELYEGMKKAGIPYDVQYADIDYMVRQMDFTLGDNFAGLPALVNQMKSEGMRFIVLLDPAISGNETSYPAFDRGFSDDVFIKWADGSDIVWGKVWPDYPNITVDESLDWDTQVELFRAYTAFPDFFRNQTATWWHREIKEFHTNPNEPEKSLKIDGLWIDMNEPSSFVHGSVIGCGDQRLNNPPYMPSLESKHLGLSHKTICMESQQFLPDNTPVRHYDVHNLYGWSHTKPTYDALLEVTGERGVVVTRSSYPSSGKWAGHWLGDNTSAWNQMYKSIIGMLEFSLFGFSYTGADICGFFSDATYQMCLRWMQLGAFYPYSRNHNGKGSKRQDPLAFDEKFQNVSRDVLNIRYTLLPYLYTLMYEAHSQGSTVVRPVFHEFVNDKITWDIHKQFLWGPALLISPVLDEDSYVVHAYIPNARWYNYHTGEAIGVRGQWLDIPTPLEQINLHIRGGYIIPWQEPSNTTAYSRNNLMGLTVAVDDNGLAQGSLFWDDGTSIDAYEKGDYYFATFNANKNTLVTNIWHNNGTNTADTLGLGYLKVWGAGNIPVVKVTVMYNGVFELIESFNHNLTTQELVISLKDKAYFMNMPIQVTWKTTFQ